jgi:hypothetical protein
VAVHLLIGYQPMTSCCSLGYFIYLVAQRDFPLNRKQLPRVAGSSAAGSGLVVSNMESGKSTTTAMEQWPTSDEKSPTGFGKGEKSHKADPLKRRTNAKGTTEQTEKERRYRAILRFFSKSKACRSGHSNFLQAVQVAAAEVTA